MLNSKVSVLLCALLLAVAGAALAKGPKPPRAEPATEWYVKTTVSLVAPGDGRVYQDTRSGVFGQLAGSELAHDRHDIPAWASTSGSPAALVFVQGADWGEQAGEYLSDYHPPGAGEDFWTFTVRSSLGSPTVTLSWDGLFTLQPTPLGTYTQTFEPAHLLFKKLQLVDLEDGTVIKPSSPGYQKKYGNRYTFDMSGQANRQFRWVLGELRPEHFTLDDTLASTPQQRTQSVLQTRQDQAAQQGMPTGRFGAPPEGAPQTGGAE